MFGINAGYFQLLCSSVSTLGWLKTREWKTRDRKVTLDRVVAGSSFCFGHTNDDVGGVSHPPCDVLVLREQRTSSPSDGCIDDYCPIKTAACAWRQLQLDITNSCKLSGRVMWPQADCKLGWLTIRTLSLSLSLSHCFCRGAHVP